MFASRVAAVALAMSAAACAVGAGNPPPQPTPDRWMTAEAAERGRLMTSTACSSCHATGAVGASPMLEAPPFREIVHRYPLDRLEEAFAEGLVTAHPAMPAFVFRASEIDDLIAYLETVRTHNE